MTFISVVPRDFMKFATLTSVLIFLPISLLCLWQGLVVLSLSYVLQAMVSLALLLWWICKSKVSLFLLLKFILDFDSMPIGISQ